MIFRGTPVLPPNWLHNCLDKFSIQQTSIHSGWSFIPAVMAIILGDQIHYIHTEPFADCS